MKRLPPSGYTPAAESSQPGYLAAKFKRLLKQQQDNAKEAAVKVTPIKEPKAAHG